MKKEIQLPTGNAIINENNTGASIAVDGFSATLRELKILGLLNRGMTRNQISEDLGMSRRGVNEAISKLLQRNTPDFTDSALSIQELTDTANYHELIYEVSILGIESIVKELKAQVPVKREVVKVVKASEIKIKPRKDSIELDINFLNKDKLLVYANEKMDSFSQNQHQYTKEQMIRIREFIIRVIEGESVSKSEIIESGINIRVILSKAYAILFDFSYYQNVNSKRWLSWKAELRLG